MANTRNLIIIAIIVGVVILGSIIIAQNRQKTTFQPQQVTAPTTQQEQKPVILETITVNLSAQNNSGENGTATLADLGNNQTKVVLKMIGAPQNIAQPSHIHLGSCAKLGDVLYPLTSLQNGEAETTLNIALKKGILDKLPLAVNVHKSGPEIAIYSTCGDIIAAPTSKSMSPSPIMTQAPDDRRRGADKPED